MAISRLVGQDNTVFFTAGGGTGTITYPGNTTAGNLLIAAVVTMVNGLPAVSGGGTWTLLGQQQLNSNTFGMSVYYKLATGSETSMTVGLLGGTATAADIFEFTGNANPIVVDGTPAVNSTTSVSTFASSSITTTNANDLIFTCLAMASAAGTSTAPSWTKATVIGSNLQNSGNIFCGQNIVATTQVAYTDAASWTTAHVPGIVIGAFQAAASRLPTIINNYQFVKVGDGMSVSEKIR